MQAPQFAGSAASQARPLRRRRACGEATAQARMGPPDPLGGSQEQKGRSLATAPRNERSASAFVERDLVLVV